MKIKKIITAAVTSIITVTSAMTSVSAAETGIRGDANQNGKTDVRDCAYIAKMLASQKSNELPADADYNRDGKANVRDAAELARDLSIHQIKNYNSAPIIPGIHIGMTKSEVIAVMGDNYSDLSDYEITYNLDSAEEFGVDLPTILDFNFDFDEKLYSFGYVIGVEEIIDGVFSYPYSKAEIDAASDKVYEKLQYWYGDGRNEKILGEWIDDFKEYYWLNTDYGMVMFWELLDKDEYGDETNAIIVICSDNSEYDENDYL